MQLSICIPTYNRATHLANCLNSIYICQSQSNLEFQLCVSDNGSTDDTESIVKDAQSRLNIKYHKNARNFGHARNFLQVVSMADGEFVWLIGDDDLLMPYAIESLYELISNHPGVDFFFVNSFNLNADFLEKFPRPFDTQNLPENMSLFSKWIESGEMPFLELINPKISFDFLGGMFLSVFRREKWILNTDVLDEEAIRDKETFSHFDNTFPHVKIFAKAFSSSKAYFNASPLNVCLYGVREWSPMYPFIHSVRLVEALRVYRKNGLSFWRYIYCKNYALNNFIPDFINMMLHKNSYGYAYPKPLSLIFDACLYPNFYLSFFYFLGRRIRNLLNRGCPR